MATTQFEIWLEKVEKERESYWNKNFSYKPYTPLIIQKGKKYIKLTDSINGSVWGFVSMVDGVNKGAVIKKGDLLMPASWRTPAKHSRGNIFEGTDSWNFNGPNYLK